MFLNISAELWRISSPDCLPLLAGRGFDAPSRLARRRAGRGFDALLPPSPRARPRDVCFGLASGLVPRAGDAEAAPTLSVIAALEFALSRRPYTVETDGSALVKLDPAFWAGGASVSAALDDGAEPAAGRESCPWVPALSRPSRGRCQQSNAHPIIRSSSPRVSFPLRLIAETTVSDFTKPAVLRFSLAGLAERLEANVTCYATRKDGVAVRAVTARCLQGFALCAAWSGRAPEPSQRILSRVT